MTALSWESFGNNTGTFVAISVPDGVGQMGSNVDALLLLRPVALADVGVEQEGVSQISKTDLMGSNVDALLLLRPVALADVGVEQEGVSQISKTDLAGRGGVLKIAWRLLISRDGDMSLFLPFDMIL